MAGERRIPIGAEVVGSGLVSIPRVDTSGTLRPGGARARAPRPFEWHVDWSSDDPKYGGCGTPDLWPGGTWSIPPEVAIVCRPDVLPPPTQGPVRRRTT